MKCRGRESYDAHQVVPSAVRSSWLQIVGRSAALVLLLASALASLSTAQRKPMPRVELEDSDVILRRQEWFYRQRTYPLGFIPAGARLRALQHLEEMQRREAAQSTRGGSPNGPAAVTNAWLPLGPRPTNSLFFTPFTSGRVTALAVDRCDSSGKTIYLGGAEGGVWKTTDGGTTWIPLTDFQPSLATGSIALDTSSCTGTPAHANAIYVGTGEENFSIDSYYGAGVLKSTDGGATWTVFGASAFPGTGFPVALNANGPYIGAIAVDPANSNIVLAALRGFGSSFDEGIWRSTNGGNSWVHVLPVTAFNNIRATDVAFDPSDTTGGTAYAALGELGGGGSKNGVYKSTDAGMTWTALTISGFSAANFGRISLAVGPPVSGSTSGVLFAAVADASTFSQRLLGVFKSANGGTTWTQLTDPVVMPANGFCNFQCWYDMAIRVSPVNPSLVFVGGAAGRSAVPETVFRSTDGGNSWADVSANGAGSTIHVDTHAFAFSADGKTLYVGNDGGAWSSTDVVNTAASAGSQHWTNLNSTLDITQFYPGHSVHPSNPRISIGGTQDNGLQKHGDDLTMATPNLSWDDLGVPCDGGFTALNTKIPSTVYGTCEYIPRRLLIIGVSYVGGDLSGNNGFLVTSGVDGTDRGAFIPPLVIDPSNPEHLYFGTFRVWQTTNGANTWSVFSPNLTFGVGVLTAMAVAPSASATIYTGSDDARAMVTTDGGLTWSDITHTVQPNGLPIRSITQMAVDPKVSTTAYVTVSGFSGFIGGDTKGHVFKTTDGGANWTDISCTAANCGTPNATDLPNIPVNDIVVDPDIPNTLYVATDVGVFQTSDAGATWATLGANSLPRVVVLSLKLQEPSRTLRAATHGRGVWDLALGNQAAFGITGISPVLAHTGDPGTTLTVIGNGFTASSQVQWNASPRTTTVASSTQLTASISTTDFAAGGAIPVAVSDPGRANPTNALAFTVLNPAPGLLSISPTSATAGASSATLTVTGSNFISSTVLRFNRMDVSTTFNNSTTLTATIPGSDLTVGQFATIHVFTPQPGGGPDLKPQIFTVNNPVPAIASLSPATVTGGGPGLTLTVTGSNFNPSSSVNWNGSSRATALVNATQVTASIASSDLLSPGSIPVTVFNPTPGGGTSNGMTFTVSAADFAFGTPSPTSQTVTAGRSASYTIPISPTGASGTALTLACSNLPPLSTCGFSANPVTPVSGGSSTTMTISTTARAALPGASIGRRGPFLSPGIWSTLAAVVLFAAILLTWRTSRRARLALGCALGVLVLGFALAGCGGGGGGGGGSGGTPPGTSTITVTGTSGAFTHSTTVTLVVQ